MTAKRQLHGGARRRERLDRSPLAVGLRWPGPAARARASRREPDPACHKQAPGHLVVPRPRRPAGRRRRVLRWPVGRQPLVPRRTRRTPAPGAAAARRAVTPGAAGAAVARRRAAASATGDTAARRALVAEAAARRRAASGHAADPTVGSDVGERPPADVTPITPITPRRTGPDRAARSVGGGDAPPHDTSRDVRRRPVRRQRRATTADDGRGRLTLLGARRPSRAGRDVRVVRRRGAQRHAPPRSEVAWNRATSIVSTSCEPQTSSRSP